MIMRSHSPKLVLTTSRPRALLGNKRSDAVGQPSHGCESTLRRFRCYLRVRSERSERSGWSPDEGIPLRRSKKARGCHSLAETLASQTGLAVSGAVDMVDSLL